MKKAKPANNKIYPKSQTRRKPAIKVVRRRPLHKKVLLHPLSIFLLLCLGVLLLVASLPTNAADYTVSTSVAAPVPASPAVITQPADQTHVTVPDITVAGTCPAESYVKIYNNDLFAGAVWCNADGTFQLAVYLSEGANTLRARVFNFTNNEGPASPAVTVYYDVPPSQAPASAVPQSISPQRRRATPGMAFHILAEYEYKVHASGEAVTLDLRLSGGVAPYAVSIDWGDGHIDPIVRSDDSAFQATHIYKEKNLREVYVVKVSGSDSANTIDKVQLLAVVNGKPNPAGLTTQKPPGLLSRFSKWMAYVWSAYAIVLLMVISFWLGERQELRLLAKQRRRVRHA
jgi:hypothetical protein